MSVKPRFLIPLALAAFAATPVCACITLTGDGKYVQTRSEAALIIWDAANGVEHFIREAEFRTESKSIGFLVPTPSVPTLADVDRDIFQTMTRITQRHEPRDWTRGRKSAGFAVVQQKEVAGYNTSVLVGTDPAGITRWLKTNGYPTDPRTEGWLKPYLEKGWAITAFKLGPQGEVANLEPVRLTFKTDHPIYPYREPRGGSADGRTLMIYLLSEPVLAAKKGDAPWISPQQLGELSEAERKDVQAKLGNGMKLPPKLQLSLYTDRSQPRDGSADLHFIAKPADATSSPGLPSIPTNVLLGGVLAAGLVWLGVRSRGR